MKKWFCDISILLQYTHALNENMSECKSKVKTIIVSLMK